MRLARQTMRHREFLDMVRRAMPLGAVLLMLAGSANSQESLQKGFLVFEPQGAPIRILSASHGLLCNDGAVESAFCGTERSITVTNRDTCTGTDGSQYPCTRYGYQFDYSGATPGDTIECRATRKDPYRSRSKDYTLTLDADEGSIFQAEWLPYSRVERRSMLTEVHECKYQGQMLANIEFIVSYEPDSGAVAATNSPAGPAPGIDEPYIDDVPNSCTDLTEAKAASLLQVGAVQSSDSNEHVANLSSTCSYTSAQAPFATVFYMYKFFPYEMFDQNKLSKRQMIFNATMLGGGTRPYKVIEDPGNFTFLFETPERTTIMVVTGMQGPMNANEPREFIATYYIEDPNKPHEIRLRELLEVAQDNFPEWVSIVKKQ